MQPNEGNHMNHFKAHLSILNLSMMSLLFMRSLPMENIKKKIVLHFFFSCEWHFAIFLLNLSLPSFARLWFWTAHTTAEKSHKRRKKNTIRQLNTYKQICVSSPPPLVPPLVTFSQFHRWAIHLRWGFAIKSTSTIMHIFFFRRS